ncbi:chemotaxis response regulator containing a CheY-like receiver domain and a methylesterase domain [Mycobacterium sp. JS623]|uniref:chemotaxis protein CheB n=1 Tax=Mycobacterium sp. JS623 TaxID=212767 RepID=UPI0002A58418|nr:chemotaxis protein CheB [Mycobacterium sp. JS623]AGB25505.1 chemotaxis response regulator containing a CheY-like receiver domain and a methylesterase domain [Mycobacterium sp. JS623]
MASSAPRDAQASGVVAIGASAGGVEALTRLAAGLTSDLPFAVLMALHVPPGAPSVLGKIVDRSGPLLAASAANGAPLESGRIHVAIPDRHLLVSRHRVVLSEGPTENGYRPAIDAMFRSVALEFGPRAIGVLMSGVLDDGVAGLGAIQARGGTTIVQQPDDALYPTMPQNAIDAGVADLQATAAEVGAVLKRLADREIKERPMDPDINMELENRIAMGKRFEVSIEGDTLGPPSGYTCPDCNGSLMTLSDTSYRCRVGHAWTADALLEARHDEVEGAVWVALRSLKEKANLSRRMAQKVGPGTLFDRYNKVADEAERAMTVLGERLWDATGSRKG